VNVPLTELAAAYGVSSRGVGRIADVASVIKRELPAEAWDAVPYPYRLWPIKRAVKRDPVRSVVGILVQDAESFESLKAGRPINADLRQMIDGSVSVSFRNGGASEFTDLVLANIGSHVSGY
jgi:hypothetical protein